ncbi:hypothetical protein CMV_016338 [Castanea mollissima]|uniref:Uncharacterized protein n=1 Tax=Castanea mollissima TaxID=60419 RepID=A0A8J4VI94_9ROSI|nr:hypothetical protein CMV_016338 [Castanea mollissima]
MTSDHMEAGDTLSAAESLSVSENLVSQGNKWKVWVIVSIPLSATVLLSWLCICFLSKGKVKPKGEKDSSNDLRRFWTCLQDPTKKQMLDWRARFHIIEGVAQGLLYLHQYSRILAWLEYLEPMKHKQIQTGLLELSLGAVEI